MDRLLVVCFSPEEGPAGAAFAAKLGLPFDILSLGDSVDDDLGAEKILAAGTEELPLADGLAPAIVICSQDYSHIASVSTMKSKDVLPRVAGLRDIAMVTDVVEVISTSVFKRPIVAGSIIATVEVLGTPIVLTFRPAGFSKVDRAGKSSIKPTVIETASKARRISVSARSSSRPDLAQAKAVVSGGRPLKDPETFERIIGGLADALGGAVGATRAAVDAGIAANELQVGQTGKIVAPDIYIAAGISGSTQHMAGIKDSKIIVAINKDPDAPIFESADYGLVADLYEAVPELTRLLK